MNIGVDLDDVLADFHKGWLRYYNDKYGTNFKKSDCYSYKLSDVHNVADKIVVKRIKHFYRTNIFKDLEPIRGAKKAVERIKKRHKLFVITSRPNWTSDTTRTWIKKYFISSFKEVIITNQFGNKDKDSQVDKSEVCKKYRINLIIEDAPTFAYDVAKSGKKVLLLDNPWNKDIVDHKNMKRVRSWKEIIRSLNMKRIVET